LSTQSKHLIDTIKMVAYRAETAMAAILREHLAYPDPGPQPVTDPLSNRNRSIA
jgi:hypothetical protein